MESKKRKPGRPVGTAKSDELLFLGRNQLRSFFDAVKKAGDTKYSLIFGLILHLGLRVSELTDLKLENISMGKRLEDWTITINGKKHGKTRTYDSTELPAKLVKSLSGWISGERGTTDNPYVFPSRFCLDKPTKPQAVKNMFKSCPKAAALPPRSSVHTLRASCAVALIAEKNTSAVEIMRWLRLRTIQNAQIYFDRLQYKETGAKVKRVFEGLF